MRGLTVQGGVEVRIEVTGESWHQGSLVHATVNSKNGAPVRLSLSLWGLRKRSSPALRMLLYGSNKKPPQHFLFSTLSPCPPMPASPTSREASTSSTGLSKATIRHRFDFKLSLTLISPISPESSSRNSGFL